MYIMALLGMEFFANRVRFNSENDDLVSDIPRAFQDGVVMHAPRENFDNIFIGLTTVFIVLIGEDWNQVMYNHARAFAESGNTGVIIFFVSIMIIGNIMLLSLFTAILLQNFEDGGPDEDAAKEGECAETCGPTDAASQKKGLSQRLFSKAGLLAF